ncbi:hypothetical protein [Acidithiobacillus caldus]|uniref:hypothetical protein n=1 Tax=Acidithiobacillus caldus TaxID=33059 RepID=UPI001C066A69|nr:hypothetical protein [Acidithiobacillus caldus]MBU2770122.1 hypothetical protein [Acidithiobacillus caldus]
MTDALREINADLAAQYPGPYGPKYWLLPQSCVVHVRGWEMDTKGKPMGTTFFKAPTFADALAWIEWRER